MNISTKLWITDVAFLCCSSLLKVDEQNMKLPDLCIGLDTVHKYYYSYRAIIQATRCWKMTKLEFIWCPIINTLIYVSMTFFNSCRKLTGAGRIGLTENARPENDGPSSRGENDGPSRSRGMKMQDLKMQDMKLQGMKMSEQIAWHENAVGYLKLQN